MSYWKKQYEDAIEKKRSQYSPANFHHHQKSPIVSPRKPNNESRIDSDSFSFSSREDMHEILSPSNDDDDVSDQSELEHGVSESYSADSIIRRVEEEIAAAKKAAASARSRLDAFTEEDDMDEILGVDTPPEDQDFHDESSFNESYDHAMDVIGEEFEDDFHDGTLATVMEAEEGQEEASVVAKESPQKFTFNEESGFRAREILGTLKERREHFSQTFTNSTKSDTGSLTEDSNSIIHRDDEKKEDENLPLPARDRMEPLLQPSQTAVTPKVRNQEVASTTTTIPKLVVQPEEVEPVQEERAVVSTPSNELANTAMKVMKTDIETCESIVSKDTRKLETETPRKSRRIRFRDPFPTLKPLDKPRSASEIIEENALGTPECQIQWLRPQNEIRHLILAVMGPSLQRRSNACGALKVLTRQRKNQLTMMRTDSFLESLVFAVSQDIQESEKDFAIDTRTRAVACLRNVCEPKENRAYIITHPGLKECLMKVMQEDRGEARVLACGAFALLAKTPECREPMAFAEGLVDLLSDVMSGVIDEKFGVANLSNTFMSDMSASVTIHSEDEDDRSHSSKESFDSRGSDSSDSSEYTSSSSGSDDSSADPASKVGLIQLSSIRKQNEEMQGEFLQRARSNACAALLHLSKHCAVSHHLCTCGSFMDNVLAVAKEFDSPIHTKCIEIICNLARFPPNATIITRLDGLIELLVLTGESIHPEARRLSLRALQNLSADSNSKTLLASENVLSAISTCALRKEEEEVEAAVAFLQNICTEPAAVVSITNTKNVVATLVHLAHHPDSSRTVRLLACDALATISLWLQTLAGTGKAPKDVPNVPLPTQKSTGWERWD